MSTPQKQTVRQLPPIRITPDAVEIVDQICEDLGWPKSKVATHCVLLVDDLLNGRKDSRFLDLIRSARSGQGTPAKAIEVDTASLSPEATQAIKDIVANTLKDVLQAQNPALNEEPTPYGTKKKKAGGNG
mgnify:CR=1 FL=1